MQRRREPNKSAIHGGVNEVEAKRKPATKVIVLLLLHMFCLRRWCARSPPEGVHHHHPESRIDPGKWAWPKTFACEREA